MCQNVGGADRVIRGVLGIWLVVVATAAFRVDRRPTAAVAGIAGIGLLQNALVGFCGCNWLFGLDTTTESCEAGCDV
ncbi:DUF2892 domain-containing protein [Natronomonas sp. CBA1123]|uniref:YgaP family membrane protein n=1 Tax=Natronomonas sp. CBA1123 TaxID=2668070 RepID=UPI0012E9B18F|nr:DUF2892 domain-containing protein [Natronomonas sp. CBA1123]MUV85282.1 DUF2892 domain-containing protein [Natronomonas sp. CBA1123]